MTTRSRQLNSRWQQTGTFWSALSGVTTTRTTSNGSLRNCDDTIDEYPKDNPLVIADWYKQTPYLEGEIRYSDGRPKYIYTRFPIDGSYDPQSPAKFPYPDWVKLKAEVAAATNPSVPSVSVPTFVVELRDLPGMLTSIPQYFRQKGLMRLGRNPLLEAANIHLSYTFGWRPLVRDLKRMLSCVDAIDQKLRYIQALSKGRRIRKRMRLPIQQASTDMGVKYTHTLGCSLAHRGTTCYIATDWVSTRWAPAYGAQVPKDVTSQRKLAERLVLGMTSYEAIASTWELLPWSWLVDWFSTTGDFIAACNNNLPLRLEGVCWMRTSFCKTTWAATQLPPVGVRLVGDYYQQAWKKERIPFQNLPTLPFVPSVPVLTDRQWSILGSILLQVANGSKSGGYTLPYDFKSNVFYSSSHLPKGIGAW